MKDSKHPALPDGWSIDGNVATFAPTGRTLTVMGDGLCIEDHAADICEYESVTVILALLKAQVQP